KRTSMNRSTIWPFDPLASRARNFIGRRASSGRLLRFDARIFNYSAPFCSLLEDKLVELGRRSNKQRACHVGDTRGGLTMCKSGVDLVVELVDDCDGRVLRSCNASPAGDLVPRQEIAKRWNVRQPRQARCTCDSERTQFARLDVCDRRLDV